jgi:hypothetical protein
MKFAAILRELFKLHAIPPKAQMHCIECGCRVRRRDKYRILAVRHIECGDARLVGQQSFEIPLQGTNGGDKACN